MPAFMIISNDTALRQQLQHALTSATADVVSVPNTRDILTQRNSRQISGYDLIVAEVEAADHDGLSRLMLFRNLYPNTPLIAITREAQAENGRFSNAAARALNAWLARVENGSFNELTQTAARALSGEEPAQPPR